MKKSKGEYKIMQTFRVTSEEQEELIEAAKMKGVSISKYIRIAIKQAILEDTMLQEIK